LCIPHHVLQRLFGPHPSHEIVGATSAEEDIKRCAGGAKSSFAAQPPRSPKGAGHATTALQGEAAHAKLATGARWAPEDFPGLSVQYSYFIGRIRDVSLVTEGARPSSLAQEQAGGHAARLTTLLVVVVVPQRVVGDQVRLQRRA